VSDTLNWATKLLKEKKIKHLPVLDGKRKLAGVITDRDLKRASASDATLLEVHELLYLLDKVKLSEVMTKRPKTATPAMTLQKAARLMVDGGIGCLPVVEKGKLVGIVTQTDLLDYLGNMKSV
jgi:acetoin utilization protein AcuB